MRDRLAREIKAARNQDEASHTARKAAVERRNAEVEQAQRVVAYDPDALLAALEEHSALGALPFAVEGIDTLFQGERIIAIVDGLDFEDMPEESVSLLKSGKASMRTAEQYSTTVAAG